MRSVGLNHHPAAFVFHMFLLYLDDSGSVNNANEQYLVLGGVCVFEHQVNYFTQELDAIARRINSNDPDSVEFHASEVFSGRTPPWNGMVEKEQRRQVIKDVLQVLAKSYGSARAFACAVHKASYPNRDPMEIAFEDLSHKQTGNPNCMCPACLSRKAASPPQ